MTMKCYNGSLIGAKGLLVPLDTAWENVSDFCFLKGTISAHCNVVGERG